MPAHAPPAIRLGAHASRRARALDLCAVERGVLKRPDQASAVRGRVQLRFRDEYPPVAMVFSKTASKSSTARSERANLTVTAGLADVVLLTTAPLRMGMPSPANARGRAVLQKMARGRDPPSGRPGARAGDAHADANRRPGGPLRKAAEGGARWRARCLDRRPYLGGVAPARFYVPDSSFASPTSRRTPKPVGPLPAYSRSESQAVPAMSRCTQGFPSTNSSRKEPA